MEKGQPAKRTTQDGFIISSSQVRRLEREVKFDKEKYDSLKIKSLTEQGTVNDPAKQKKDATELESLRKQIRSKEQTIIDIKLQLK
mmetsp:Transcript_11008/g.18395  ORF Transcript_11008/g.18395 Transcript_11008/m.18395 type:complete len:86 (-) Transcript_11008:130-387(-)|eukprot:CAMPEP_0168623692 /NCGR_PEP_ID=MMETSP0449_2-20121227/8968_1 /TAXON_ID=1082188 /ORGANISM="Strombidium rassoulzadegani, Strain ras09" /LENGTH=85 /DNA_ID=CAMNT_0008665105 /DNA_START=12 /DNA_END=269 /DNA_ORIENTATION=-